MSVALSLRPLGEALGTEVVGVDVSRPFDAATLEWIDRAFAEHPVMVFRNQRLGPAELAAFGSQFGRPQPHILDQYRHPDRADVSYITNVDKAERNRSVRGDARLHVPYRRDVRGRAATAGHPPRAGGAIGQGRHDVRRHAQSL